MEEDKPNRYFIGILTNVDKSVEGLDIGHGFIIKSAGSIEEIREYVEGPERQFESSWGNPWSNMNRHLFHSSLKPEKRTIGRVNTTKIIL